MAVADYVDDTELPPPPELVFYIHTRDFGDPWGKGWLAWPPLTFATTLLVRNVYNAWHSYTKAESRVDWLKKHEGGAEIVGMVKEYRYEEEPEMTAFERWEAMAGDEIARKRAEWFSTAAMYG